MLQKLGGAFAQRVNRETGSRDLATRADSKDGLNVTRPLMGQVGEQNARGVPGTEARQMNLAETRVGEEDSPKVQAKWSRQARRSLAQCFGLHARAPWVIPSPFAIWLRPAQAAGQLGDAEKRKLEGWLGAYQRDGWYQPTRKFWLDHCQEGHAPNGQGCDIGYHINMFTPNVSQQLEWGYLMPNGQVEIATPEMFEEECRYFTVVEPTVVAQETENWILRTSGTVLLSVLIAIAIFGLFFWAIYHYARKTEPTQQAIEAYEDRKRVRRQNADSQRM